jgi:hypothetical protein
MAAVWESILKPKFKISTGNTPRDIENRARGEHIIKRFVEVMNDDLSNVPSRRITVHQAPSLKSPK